MVTIKTDKELQYMQEGGDILKSVVKKIFPSVRAGVTTKQIDDLAEKLIRAAGAEPSFMRVKNYKWTTCLPINEQVVHTPPSNRIIQAGDVLTLDIGVYYKGLHTDYATSWIVEEASIVVDNKKNQNFLKVGEETLTKAIEVAKKAKYIGEISALIQKEIYGAGYHIMRDLTGHGIGEELHEDPYIPGFLDRAIEKTYKIRAGLAIAIEVIYSMGTEEIMYEKGSDWSIATADGSMSACFEHTIGFFTDKIEVLT